jgi:hypothetical protein
MCGEVDLMVVPFKRPVVFVSLVFKATPLYSQQTTRNDLIMLRKENLREFTPQERAEYSGPGVRALLALKSHWRITDSNISRMLGRPSRTELKEWLRAAQARERVILSSEQLHRISAIIKVFDALNKRYDGAQEKSSRWLRTPHKAASLIKENQKN